MQVTKLTCQPKLHFLSFPLLYPQPVTAHVGKSLRTGIPKGPLSSHQLFGTLIANTSRSLPFQLYSQSLPPSSLFSSSSTPWQEYIQRDQRQNLGIAGKLLQMVGGGRACFAGRWWWNIWMRSSMERRRRREGYKHGAEAELK